MKKIVAMFAVCNNVPITNEIKLIIINHESLQNVVPDMLGGSPKLKPKASKRLSQILRGEKKAKLKS